MLRLLPVDLRDRASEQLDRVIHSSTAVSVAFTGMSLEEIVLILPALVSVVISILAWIAKKADRKQRMEIYRQEERRRTEAILKYLNDSGGTLSASIATKASRAVSSTADTPGGGGGS